MKPFIIFKDRKYSVDISTGYVRAHRPPRTYLHRDMWTEENGPIPDGHDIHHVDGNKEHNELSNFECVSRSDHQIKYSPVRKETPLNPCNNCKKPIARNGQSPSAYNRRKYCSSDCFGASNRGRPSPNPNCIGRGNALMIRHLCSSGERRDKVAAMYHVSVSAINAIMSGQNYK